MRDYGALPHTPHAFLKKACEKQCFTAKSPTHFVRARLGGNFFFKTWNSPFFAVHKFNNPNSDSKPNPIITKTPNSQKTPIC